MNSFEFSTATRIIFGSGKFTASGKEIADLGKIALVTSGVSGSALESEVIAFLKSQGISCEILPVLKEPTTSMIQSAVQMADLTGCDFVLGLGGGSAIDTGKAAATMITNPGDIFEYLEIVGLGKPITREPMPFVAVPTTAGTGAEVTKNAVLEVEEQGVKVSLRSSMMFAKLAIVDPTFTLQLPPEITAASGLDALTQLIEPFVSNRANPFTDMVCRQGLRLVSRSLRDAYFHGENLEAREGMALASLYGGLALANAKLGAVHGFAAPLGGMIHASHGAICARLLPEVMGMNVKALQARAPKHPALDKYLEIARILTGRDSAAIEDGVLFVEELVQDLDIPGLQALGFETHQLIDLVQKASNASSMGGNPIELSNDELGLIIENSL